MSITLEPIAAISAVIPQELRLLNIALVDVGAGTSDIAITNNGSVCAYTMATMAGDEITERVMREFLVDFQMAEKMKFMLSEGKELIAYCDILGFEYNIPSEELRQRILSAVEELAQMIAQQILEINGAPPMAVFMVGGGSRTPELCRLVAQNLSIDEKKVAIGGNNYMKRMVETEPQYISAEYATPIGIAISAMSAQGQENLSVVINGQRVRMMRIGAMTLLEALLRAGYQYGQIMGRSGRSVTYALDGEKKVARGGVPTLAEFEVNGRAANITTPLEAGDSVRFTPAVNGMDARPLARDTVKDFAPFAIEYNGETVQAGVYVTINGTLAEAEDEIHEADKVHVLRITTLGDLLAQTDGALETTVVNGVQCTADYILKEGDCVSAVASAAPAPPVLQQPLTVPEPVPSVVPVDLQMTQAQPPGPDLSVTPRAQAPALSQEPAVQETPRHGAVQIILNGSPVLLPGKPDGTPNLFFDVLNYVEIDPDHPQGEPVIRRNERAASYIEPIHDGDRIEVYWG
nr:cell division FtsA domain-containing protein [Anaerotruncus colihominis]